MLVEVCANSLESAMNAEKAGADRIELCSELGVGGITPSYGLLKTIADKISIPVRVLIRPRSGDFMYSNLEVDIMMKDIQCCKDLGFEGVVLGMLQNDFKIDQNRFYEIQEISHGLQLTFHRAFDWVSNPFDAFIQIKNFNVDTLLTSGQQPTAIEGIDLLSELNQDSGDVVIMPGSGVNPSNAHLFKEKGFKAIHLSATKMHKKLNTPPNLPISSPKLLSDDSVFISHLETIQEVIAIVK